MVRRLPLRAIPHFSLYILSSAFPSCFLDLAFKKLDSISCFPLGEFDVLSFVFFLTGFAYHSKGVPNIRVRHKTEVYFSVVNCRALL